MFKALKIKVRPKRKLTFHFNFEFRDDGTIWLHNEKWNAPFIVPEDHPNIMKLLQRGDVSLIDVKYDKPKTEKKKED